ncbi:hypothetical protein ZIOFF_035205 [Zingiber officinale]|uniref:dUTP diphosphatase n=1 Tax=Zingiber officinale TaxID=94328 RepID=A0A8J5L7A2_ZINOF|nr:hypothetical protein ZIOFF_035205 [Zingiber officinale]
MSQSFAITDQQLQFSNLRVLKKDIFYSFEKNFNSSAKAYSAWNIQVSILTRGYEGWINGEANLLITRGLVGRLSNTPNVGFAYEKLEILEERIKRLEERAVPTPQALPEAIIQSLTDRVKTLSLQEKPKEAKEIMTSRGTNPPVTTITRTNENAPLFEDQIRDYRQNQRRRYNMKRTIQRVSRRLTGGSYNHSLEQQMDPQAQLRLSMQERAAIVPAEVLYHSRRDDAHHRVYIHRSEEAMLVTKNQIDRAFIQQESYAQLQRSGMRFLHMGVIQVRIQILHRQEEGTMALIVFRDNRWQGDQAIFATMEIDLTHGSQLVYVISDTMLTVSDFYRNIQVSILTRGYEGWRNGEANLLITRGLVGRLSNTPNVGFAYEVQNVVDYLVSHGVRALPGRSYSTRDMLGHNWIIRQSTINIPMQPTEVNTRNLLDGSVSKKFDSYQAASTSSAPKYNSKDDEIQSDEEEITNHTVAVLIEPQQEEEMLVKRISSLAQLPVRSTTGAAGYDISITYAQDIPAKDKSLLSTGLCIQIPKNTYARIAPRSSAAIKGIMIMGGVIDSDYRGEVKILAFNTTNQDIFLSKQECIAQIILERISTPTIKEVDNLEDTSRGNRGFGSTTRTFKNKPTEDGGFNFAAKFTNQNICSKAGPNSRCPGCHFCYEEDFNSPSPTYNQYNTITGDEVMTLQAEARQCAIRQHKFLEEEAYQQLVDGPDSLERSLAITRRQHRTSQEYRRQLQRELDNLPTSSSSSTSTRFLCAFTNDQDICQKNGLILSPTKMKIGSPTIEFLGATIGQSTIKLQAHIISKVADFKDEELKTTKGLRSWLGLLNYARSYIPNLGKTFGPLYSKTSPNGERRMNSQDWRLIREVKAMVKNLPDLTIPPEKCFVIIEADGCMDGWGGILKWKQQKYDSKASEQISAYASGKFSPPKSTINAEIHAVMNSLNSFKIYYLDKEELLIRIDCQAIISFFNKSAQNKPSRVRWIAFTDFITGLGIPVQFQHIEGNENILADALSRLVCLITGPCILETEDHQIMVQIESALKEMKEKPNPQATQALIGVINSWLNTSPLAVEPAHGPAQHKKKICDHTLPTLSGQLASTLSTTSGSSSSSWMPKNKTLYKGASSPRASTSTTQMLYQK